MRMRRTVLVVDLKDRRVTAEEASLLLKKAVKIAELAEQSMESTLTTDDFLVWELKAISPEILEATFYHGSRSFPDCPQRELPGVEFPVTVIQQRTLDIEESLTAENFWAELNR